MDKKQTAQETKKTSYDDLLDLVIKNPVLKELIVPNNIATKYGLESGTKVSWADLIDEVKEDRYLELSYNMHSILNKRKENEWNFLNIPLKFQTEARKGAEAIEGLKYNKSLEIGRGAAGVVFVHDEELDICVKYLHDPNKSKNTLFQEFKLLDSASKIKFKRLNIPKPNVFIPNQNPAKNIFTMERVHGITVEQIELEPNEFLKVTTGDKNTIRIIIDDLRKHIDDYVDDIEILHKNKIIHADLHVRNVMLDENGKVYLIDFGNSIDANNPSSEYTKAESIYESLENIKEQGRDSIKNILKILFIVIFKDD